MYATNDSLGVFLLFLQLADSEFSPVFRLLTVFAYGTYTDYLGMFPVVLRNSQEMNADREGRFRKARVRMELTQTLYDL